MTDKCVKCLDEKISAGAAFDIDDIPEGIVTIPHFQVWTMANGQSAGGVASIRVCLNHRKKELKPGPTIQPVQGVLLKPNGDR